HVSRGQLIVIFLLATLCVAFLRVNYLIYSAFLTPTFVLLAEMSAGDWHLARLRVMNTLIGGALGLAGSWLLWPTPERDRFPELAAQALRAAARHLRLVATMWNTTDEESSVALAAARRDAALAATNAEASFERLVAESARGRRALEPGTTLLAFTRRLVAADIALGTLRHAPEGPAMRTDVTRFAGSLTTCLELVADAVGRRLAPPPCAAAPAAAGAHAELTEPQVHRILRQFELLHAAAAVLGSGRAHAGAADGTQPAVRVAVRSACARVRQAAGGSAALPAKRYYRSSPSLPVSVTTSVTVPGGAPELFVRVCPDPWVT